MSKDQVKNGLKPTSQAPIKKIRLVKINGHTVDRSKLERLELDPAQLGNMMMAVRGAKIDGNRPTRNIFDRNLSNPPGNHHDELSRLEFQENDRLDAEKHAMLKKMKLMMHTMAENQSRKNLAESFLRREQDLIRKSGKILRPEKVSRKLKRSRTFNIKKGLASLKQVRIAGVSTGVTSQAKTENVIEKVSEDLQDPTVPLVQRMNAQVKKLKKETTG
jgi:hypothetical protein